MSLRPLQIRNPAKPWRVNLRLQYHHPPILFRMNLSMRKPGFRSSRSRCVVKNRAIPPSHPNPLRASQPPGGADVKKQNPKFLRLQTSNLTRKTLLKKSQFPPNRHFRRSPSKKLRLRWDLRLSRSRFHRRSHPLWMSATVCGRRG